MIYTGRYKALRAAEQYTNSVGGSTANDMFYVRNGTGLRNCTVTGLTGTLGAANTYGTKRPSAGAYVLIRLGYSTRRCLGQTTLLCTKRNNIWNRMYWIKN